MLIKKDVLDSLSAIIEEMNKVSVNGETDYVYLAALGNKAKIAGILYQDYNCDNFRDFISKIKGLEIFRDENINPPVDYVRKKGTLQVKVYKTATVKNAFEKAPSLTEWAFLGDFLATYEDLRQLALEEEWGEYTDEKGRTHYPILENYLNNIFKKLYTDKAILYSKDGQYASFNTGLVDDRYLPIFALFEKNLNQDRQEWYLLDFCIAGENKAGKTLNAKFADRPPLANFFKSKSDLLFDTNKDVELDYEHIILERVDRLPYDFIKWHQPEDFAVLPPDKVKEMSPDLIKTYYISLSEAIKSDKSCYRSYVNALNNALDVAIKRVQWNFKSAIPMYYPAKHQMCHFLPLSLVKDNVIDLALVVEKTESGRYQGATIYPLDWAYKYARLICRPDSDWLKPQTSKRSDDAGASDEMIE